eukprot:scaffold3491_cov153-Pinguiococcus_pyrenoidosus.AAC.1
MESKTGVTKATSYVTDKIRSFAQPARPFYVISPCLGRRQHRRTLWIAIDKRSCADKLVGLLTDTVTGELGQCPLDGAEAACRRVPFCIPSDRIRFSTGSDRR